MQPLVAIVQEGQQVSMSLARRSQAMVIHVVDRMAGPEQAERPGTIRRMWRLQFDLAGRLAGDPAQFLDSIYLYAERSLNLHHEFAHRLFEALDAGDPSEDVPESSKNVIPLLGRTR